MIYLDNAATSWPKPHAVYNEVLNCMRKYCANPGRSGHKMAIQASEKIYECRENICKIFGIANPLCVSFTSNTTEALNMGIKGLLKPGDHAIITSMEHNSVLRPLKKLETSGVKLSIAKADINGRVNPKDILKYINKKTKLIINAFKDALTKIKNNKIKVEPKKVFKIDIFIQPEKEENLYKTPASSRIRFVLSGMNSFLINGNLPSAHPLQKRGPKIS